MELFGYNRHIACEPFKTTDIKLEVKSGFATLAQKTSLTKLKVLAGTSDIPNGSFIFLPSEHCKMPWAQKDKVFKLENGTEFILVPEEMILLVEKEPFKLKWPNFSYGMFNKENA